MTRGKTICNVLKAIRQKIADANNIPYSTRECHFGGECLGTCPACENELAYIQRQLQLRRMAGKAVMLVGLSAGMASLTACGSGKSQAIATDSDTIEKMELGKVRPIKKAEVRKDGSYTGVVLLKDGYSLPVKRVKSSTKFAPPTPRSTKKDGKRKAKQPAEACQPLQIVGEVAAPPIPFPDSSAVSDTDRIFGIVEEMPSFPGGPQALMEYLKDHVHYPPTEACVQGRVIVSFVVEKDGSISNIEVAADATEGFEAEAFRLLGDMPEWTPAMWNDRLVRSFVYGTLFFKVYRNGSAEVEFIRRAVNIDDND